MTRPPACSTPTWPGPTVARVCAPRGNAGLERVRPQPLVAGGSTVTRPLAPSGHRVHDRPPLSRTLSRVEDWLIAAARARPGHVALVADEGVLTYAQLDERANRRTRELA